MQHSATGDSYDKVFQNREILLIIYDAYNAL